MSYTHPDSMRGHVAIITGGAQGVGKGIAAALLERGAAVLLVDILEEKLAATTGTPVKSLMRMFGPKGNPTAANLSEVIRVLQKKTGVHLEVRASAA